LSLAINRRTIIEAEFNGKTEPTQAMPGPESYFYDPVSDKAYIQYDPERANRLLDELGLKRRDYEGYRTFRDGSRMLFYVNFSGRAAPGWTQFLMEDWKNVGIRAILRMKSRQLFYTEKITRKHDFTVWGSNGEYLPILDPKSFIPMGGEANYALGFAQWYVHGGLYGNPKANKASCIEPPKDHPLRRALEIYEQVRATGDREKQRLLLREAMRTAAENVWTIGISTSPPVISVVKNGFRNVPRNAVESWDFLSPGNAGIETYYFEDPLEIPGTVHQMQQAILKVTPSPDTPAAMAEAEAAGGGWTGRIIKYLLLGSAALVVLLMAVRHPYIGRRLLLMVPMLAVISMIVFAVIQLPPGDYVTSRIMELEEQGETVNLQQIEELREMFFLDDPLVTQYVRWSGLKWFTTFKVEDKGLLQGNLGRSMLGNNKPVTQIVGDRILLTVLISLGTILFTWAIAVPLGIYSAVRQYSVGDYVLTLIGFFGMCIPGFLLALILMYFSMRVLGLDVSGLFSSRYAAQPHWDWPKALDLLKHIWVPVVILGIGGTAGMLRVMRGNLLDELKKPYVTTARAKGVRPIKLLMKYPVRLALNPFISGIGGIFPALLSGGGIMAIVLSLPTIGPMMLSALMEEDLYLAGSMLMVFSLLGIFGTLVSDLLLLWVDPRIRFQGGNR
jgi:ABC-type dipeptide/oligopeptide/nickel transport system permease component